MPIGDFLGTPKMSKMTTNANKQRYSGPDERGDETIWENGQLSTGQRVLPGSSGSNESSQCTRSDRPGIVPISRTSLRRAPEKNTCCDGNLSIIAHRQYLFRPSSSSGPWIVTVRIKGK